MTRTRRQPAANLTDVLDDIEHKVDGDPSPESLTVDEVLSSVGRRSYGPLLLVIGLFTISPATVVPGLTWFGAALTFLVAGQMALGMTHIWLPRAVSRIEVPRQGVLKGIAGARGLARRIDTVLKPRLTFLAKPPFVNLIALLIIAAALITFPLGLIPLAPLAPGLAVVFFGLGMTAQDGLWLAFGAGALGVAGWLAAPLIF